jgi:hypothetical protein
MEPMTETERPIQDVVDAIDAVQAVGVGPILTARIADLERRFTGAGPAESQRLLETEDLGQRSLRGALTLKRLAGQIDVIVHAVGILTALPYVLAPGEVVESLSLGAGTGGKLHDLETNRQVAEFKFIQWQKTGNSVRENSLFVDYFRLTSAVTQKRRVLYVVGAHVPRRFLRGGRALTSVLSQNATVAERFRTLHGTRFATVRDFADFVGDLVMIVDLVEVVPGFAKSVG